MGFGRKHRPVQLKSDAASPTRSEALPERGPVSAGTFQAGFQAHRLQLAEGVDGAESIRLMDEMKTLAQRNAWAGVERLYAEITALDAEIDGYAHVLGAQAAQNSSGDAREQQMRYRKARAAGVDVDSALEEIDDQYVGVYISSTTKRPSDKKAERIGGPLLSISALPFRPDLRKAVKFAQAEFADQWSFNGMLPHGIYTMEHEGRSAEFAIEGHTSNVTEKV